MGWLRLCASPRRVPGVASGAHSCLLKACASRLLLSLVLNPVGWRARTRARPQACSFVCLPRGAPSRSCTRWCTLCCALWCACRRVRTCARLMARSFVAMLAGLCVPCCVRWCTHPHVCVVLVLFAPFAVVALCCRPPACWLPFLAKPSVSFTRRFCVDLLTLSLFDSCCYFARAWLSMRCIEFLMHH